MSFEIVASDAGAEFVSVIHEGEVTGDELMNCRRYVLEAFSEIQNLKLLVDFSNATVIPGHDYFFMYFAMHKNALNRLSAIAVVHKESDEQQFDFVSRVAHFHGINCQSFYEQTIASRWLVVQ